MKRGGGSPQPGRKRLSGVRVLVGRARHQAGALSEQLRAEGATVIEIPFIEIRRPRSFKPLDQALRNLDLYDWLVLTSVNGVEALWERMTKLRITKRDLRHLKIASIGPATKKAVEKLGLKVDVVPEEYVAESVVKSLRTKVRGQNILLARARVARDVIPLALRKVAARVDVVEAYETIVPRTSRARLRAVMKDSRKRPQIVTFASSSSVRNFYALLDSSSRKPIPEMKMASIGPVTSDTLRELGMPVSMQAREFTIPGLVKAICDSR
jgi:uroporphyrinogen-III synthase